MAWYLVQINIRPEQMRAMLETPQDRAEVARKTLEAMGGRLHQYFYAFGEWDLVLIGEVPDDGAAMAVAMTVVGGGGVAAYKTTKLFSSAEAMEAMRKAGQITGVYKPVTG